MTAQKTLAAPVTSTGPAESELGSAAQRERRKRILDATLALASKGGYDAVQMREGAERADVALGTLYRYFPSKIHLLLSGLIREVERTKEKLDQRPIPRATPAARLLRRYPARSAAGGRVSGPPVRGAGRAVPYQAASSQRELDRDGGSSRAPASRAARGSSRPPQGPSAISSWSTLISVVVAS